jgi:hypothetical protein
MDTSQDNYRIQQLRVSIAYVALGGSNSSIFMVHLPLCLNKDHIMRLCWRVEV